MFEVSYRLAVPDWASKKNGVTAIQAAVRLRLYDRVSAHVTPIAMSDQNGWFKGLNVVCKSFGWLGNLASIAIGFQAVVDTPWVANLHLFEIYISFKFINYNSNSIDFKA